MKYVMPLALFVFFSFHQLQAQDVIEKIAEKSCTCLKDIDTTADMDKIQAELGICMIQNASQYEKELKKQAHIDISDINGKSGEKLGELVGAKMIGKCPKEMMRLVSASNKSKEAPVAKTTETASANNYMNGTVTELQNGQFVTVVVKDANGREQKLLWLGYFNGSEQLKKSITDLKSKTFKIGYSEKELYNPSLKEYIKYKVISSLESK